MQCRTDEARDRFTSQHAHVVQGGVHLLRGASEGVAESEAVKVPSPNGAVRVDHSLALQLQPFCEVARCQPPIRTQQMGIVHLSTLP
jgi:hypothetical protein